MKRGEAGAHRRALLVACVLTLFALPCPAEAARADEKRPDQGELSESPFATAPSLADSERVAVDAALARGLDFLASQQELTRDGSFPTGDRAYTAPVGVTALAALAFMAAGNTPDRGPHSESVARAIDYLLSRVTPADQEASGYITDSRDQASRTHGHGLATLALAQAYSMSPLTRRGRLTAQALPAAVRRIEVSQSSEGGWQYTPQRNVQHEGSVTVCLVQGLRAARNAGIEVDVQVIKRAIEYVKRLQNEDGSFRYGLHENQVSVALTAACLSTLHATGIYDGAAIDDGYGYIWRELTARDLARERGSAGVTPGHPYYERFYLSQALWQHRDGEVFESWAGPERHRVLVAQRADGSWSDSRYGDSYATAMNCLFLALPEGLLPIFQR